MSKVLYIGEIPGSYGGITRKSELLENKIKKYNDTNVVNINVKEHKKISYIISVLKILFLLRKSDKILYCLDNKRLFPLLRITRLFFKKKSENITIVFSGGEFDDFFNTNSKQLSKDQNYWIEIRSVIDTLKKRGFKNITYYPNPRIQQVSCIPLMYDGKRPLKLLYYSQISKEKGVLDAIKIAKQLDKLGVRYKMDFYGWIADDVKDLFNNFLENNFNVSYNGVNDNKDINQYFSTINKYDLMLFPTYWRGEGIAGACVEAKIAGVAIIASNHNYNIEIINADANEGIIINKGNIAEYVESIVKLYNDPNKLNKLKWGSYKSRKRFDVSFYEGVFKL